MIPILRRTRRFTVAGLAAGTLVTGGLVGQLALHQHGSATSGNLPSQQPSAGATSSSSSASSSASASSSTSSRDGSYNRVPPVNNGSRGGSDSNTRGS